MQVKTFPGGVHPDDKKDLSQDFPIRDVSVKKVVIPITQGGAPNDCLVKVGDHVQKGQLIGKSDKFMSSPVHASIAGTVKKIAPHTVTGNGMALCVTIEGDDSGETDYMDPLDPFTATKDEALARVRDAGIVGMGGASFPTVVKLTIPEGKKADYVLINAAECEPYLTCDERLLQEYPDKIIDGLAIAVNIVGASKGIVVLEDNKSYIYDILVKTIAIYKKDFALKAGHENIAKMDLSVQLVKTKYPQGSEKFIISAVTGREVPSGKLPLDAGCIVLNAGTAGALADAFRKGRPLTDRALTISGEGVDRSLDIRVPIGTIISSLTPELFNIKGSCVKVLSGGPMMGFAMWTADFPVTKGSSGVTFLMSETGESRRGVYEREEMKAATTSPCIGCARCIDACPMRLNPVLMVRAMKTGDYEKAKKFGLMDCIECGSCAYMCPARIPLVQQFRLGKQTVRAMQNQGR